MPIYKMSGRKDGKQKYRVRINYKDVMGNPRQVDRVVYGADEAKLLELTLKQDIRQEAPAKRITLKELFDDYCKIKKNELRETTLDKIKRTIELHVIPQLGNLNLNKLTAPALISWKSSIDNLDLSLNTKKNIYKVFRGVLNFGVKIGYISSNPLLKIGNFKSSTETKKEMDFYTPGEFKKFITAARQFAEKSEKSGMYAGWDYYVFFALAFYTGLRKGEIHGLRWEDISGGYLSVKRSIAQKLKGEDRETPPKNKSSIRTLQLPAPLIDILEKHKARWEKYEGFNLSFKVCGGERCLRDTSIENHNKKFAKKAGIKKIRIHDFRHSHASLLANNGINIQEIARRLGHSNVEITWNTYSHLYPKEEERAIQILNKIV